MTTFLEEPLLLHEVVQTYPVTLEVIQGAIARLKDDKQRKSLLKDAIAKDMSLSKIKERIAALKAADEEEKPVTIRQQFDSAYQQMKKSKVWDDPKKQRKLEKLLADLEALMEA